MKGKKRTGVIPGLLISLLLIMLVGCGSVKVPETILVSAVSVDKDGTVTAYVVEAFDKSYYSLEELRVMVTEEIDDFNANHRMSQDGKAAQVISVSETGDVLKRALVVLEFQNTAFYREYMEKDLFFGTVSEAIDAGYKFHSELVSVKNEDTLNSLTIGEKGEHHILIVEDKVRVYGPWKPQYINTGAVMNEDGSVEPSDTEENTFIIMK